MSDWIKERSVSACVVAGSLALVLGVIALIINGSYGEWDDIGQRGDWIGGHLAAAGSIAGTFFFLAALIMQSRDLRVQSEMLQATLKEMEKSTQVANEQKAQLEQQVKVATDTALMSRFIELVKIRDDLRSLQQQYIDRANAQTEMNPHLRDIYMENERLVQIRIANADYLLGRLLERIDEDSMGRAFLRILAGMTRPNTGGPGSPPT
ncbi:MAG: hypothetical protein H6812_13700 [Phycisphaeraceae bacterium]|nr:hypothetical protein [Phycisphaeraceae bacterium]